jgi:hypothetical protein
MPPEAECARHALPVDGRVVRAAAERLDARPELRAAKPPEDWDGIFDQLVKV